VVDLSVSIVSFRTPEHLAHCLAALAALDAERPSLMLDVTVVDNASADGSAELVATRFPWVRLIQNTRNAGFGAAHNQALHGAHGRHLLVLNSDATPRPGALRTLVDYLDHHPSVAVAGPRLLHPDGTIQPSRRRFPTPATLFCESTQLQRFWPKNAVLDRFYVADRSDDEPQEVDWLVGACLCVRAAAAAEVGLFDQGYFLYSEELDWCQRFRAAGWRVAYVPQAVVEHVEGASSGRNLIARDRLFQSSKLRYTARWHGRGLARLLRAYLILEYLARAAEESSKLTLRRGSPSERAERRQRVRMISAGLASLLRP
jgi:GT2 family glycosyltransferase